MCKRGEPYVSTLLFRNAGIISADCFMGSVDVAVSSDGREARRSVRTRRGALSGVTSWRGDKEAGGVHRDADDNT